MLVFKMFSLFTGNRDSFPFLQEYCKAKGYNILYTWSEWYIVRSLKSSRGFPKICKWFLLTLKWFGNYVKFELHDPTWCMLYNVKMKPWKILGKRIIMYFKRCKNVQVTGIARWFFPHWMQCYILVPQSHFMNGTIQS